MSFEWKIVKLQDVCEKITDGSHSSPKSVDHGCLMASVKDMTYQNFDLSGCRKIAEEDYQKLVANGCKPEVNDVLIAKDGNTLLKYVFVNKDNRDLVLLSSIAILRPNQKVLNPHFLRYYLTDSNTKKLLLQGYSSGSAIPRVVLKDFKQLPLPLPSIKEQQAIADRLSILDDKIELNSAINKNLEEMAQALFKRWFVDFEFPNEHGEPFKSSGGEFEESELGLIPKGWRVVALDDVCDVNASTISTKDIGKNIEYLDTGSITKNYISELQHFNVGEDKIPSRAKRKIKANDIVYSTVRPNQHHYGLIKEPSINMVASTGFAVLTSKGAVSNDIVYLWLTQDEITEKLQSMAESSTSTYPSIRPSDISTLKFLLPSRDKCVSLTRIIETLHKQIWEHQKQNRLLSNIRDSLLPKLMSGEIRVPLNDKYLNAKLPDLPLAAESKAQYTTT